MSLFKALLTCRGRVCLPENTRVDAFGRANPAPTALVEIILIGNIVQVEVEQACGGSLIFYCQRHELLLKIERYSCRIRIYREESATCLVVGEEVTLDEVC